MPRVSDATDRACKTGRDKGYRAVDYGRLTAVLIEAVKELKAENNNLRSRVESLEKR